MRHTPSNELPALIQTGLQMVDERLRDAPGFAIYLSIQAQLESVKHTVDAGDQPTEQELGSLTLGLHTAHDLEQSDPELAEILSSVNYLIDRR
jgi:Tsi6